MNPEYARSKEKVDEMLVQKNLRQRVAIVVMTDESRRRDSISGAVEDTYNDCYRGSRLPRSMVW